MGSIDPKGGWVPGGPSVTKAPAYQAWLKANPWLDPFLPQMTSPYTQAPALTPTQAQLFTAMNTATANVLAEDHDSRTGAQVHRPAGQLLELAVPPARRGQPRLGCPLLCAHGQLGGAHS